MLSRIPPAPSINLWALVTPSGSGSLNQFIKGVLRIVFHTAEASIFKEAHSTLPAWIHPRIPGLAGS
jgi:hypothetical protein